MKGVSVVTEILLIVGIIFIAIMYFTQYLPGIVSDTAAELAKLTADGLSKDLANLMTISMATTGSIEINYEVENNYKVTVADKIVTVELPNTEIEICKSTPIICTGSTKTTAFLESVMEGNDFTIKKDTTVEISGD